MKAILLPAFTFIFAVLQAQSDNQHIITPNGSEQKGESLYLTWTLGDLVTEAQVTTTGMVTQGFQQPTLQVYPFTEGDEGKEITQDPQITVRASSLDVAVYPNPFNEEITVNVNNEEKEYYIDLLDATGRLISRNKVSSPQETLNLSKLPSAEYLLRVSLVASDESRIFQLIKSR